MEQRNYEVSRYSQDVALCGGGPSGATRKRGEGVFLLFFRRRTVIEFRCAMTGHVFGDLPCTQIVGGRCSGCGSGCCRGSCSGSCRGRCRERCRKCSRRRGRRDGGGDVDNDWNGRGRRNHGRRKVGDAAGRVASVPRRRKPLPATFFRGGKQMILGVPSFPSHPFFVIPVVFARQRGVIGIERVGGEVRFRHSLQSPMLHAIPAQRTKRWTLHAILGTTAQSATSVGRVDGFVGCFLRSTRHAFGSTTRGRRSWRVGAAWAVRLEFDGGGGGRALALSVVIVRVVRRRRKAGVEPIL